jgi:hypothetical protein
MICVYIDVHVVKVCAVSYFNEIARDHFPQVAIERKGKGIVKCNTCVAFKYSLDNASDPKGRQTILQNIELHNTIQTNERMFYRVAAERSRHFFSANRPACWTDWMCITIDGMDQVLNVHDMVLIVL